MPDWTTLSELQLGVIFRTRAGTLAVKSEYYINAQSRCVLLASGAYASKADEELQPTFYLAALAQMGEPVPDGKFRYYIFTKAKSPKAQILETSRTAGEMLWLFELIRQTWQAIEAGMFPSNPTTWKCNPKYCDYWNMCRGAF